METFCSSRWHCIFCIQLDPGGHFQPDFFDTGFPSRLCTEQKDSFSICLLWFSISFNELASVFLRISTVVKLWADRVLCPALVSCHIHPLIIKVRSIAAYGTEASMRRNINQPVTWGKASAPDQQKGMWTKHLFDRNGRFVFEPLTTGIVAVRTAALHCSDCHYWSYMQILP